MKKHMLGENGICYTLGSDGLYYPDLELPKRTHDEIGKYGKMRCEYLKLYHKAKYMEMFLNGRLNEYLHEIDEECYRLEEQLIERKRWNHGTMKSRRSVVMGWYDE